MGTTWDQDHYPKERSPRRLPKSQVDSKLTSTRESTQTATEPLEVSIAPPEEDLEVDNQKRCSLVTNKTTHVLPNGFKKLLITCEADMEILLMNNRVFCAEIAQNISTNKRLRIVQRARELNVRLTNATAKARKETTE